MLNDRAFLGQLRLVPPPQFPPPPLPPGAFGSCPPGQRPFRDTFSGKTVCVVQGYAPAPAAGVEPGSVGVPQVQPPVEFPPSTLEDLGPEPVPTPSGLPCPAGQYRPLGSGWCVPIPVPVQTGYRIPTMPFGGLFSGGPSTTASSFM